MALRRAAQPCVRRQGRLIYMLGDVIGQFVGEVVGYATGRVLLAVVRPQVGAEPLSSAPEPKPQPWYALTYLRSGKRYYHRQAVSAVGIGFWLFVIAALLAGKALKSA